jgi:AcrR family transcriptional regulator
MSEQLLASTRERLLQAAQELIEEGGYGGASVAAIAERAGVAAGTLYRHFDSKQELFVELFRLVCAREERAMRAAAERFGGGSAVERIGGGSAVERINGDSAVERLEEVFATFAKRALRNPRLAWALLAEPVDPLVDAERLDYRQRYAALIAEGLRAGISAGELPAQNVELTAAALVGGCGEALVGPLSPVSSRRPSSAELVAALRVFVRRAVGAAGS